MNDNNFLDKAYCAFKAYLCIKLLIILLKNMINWDHFYLPYNKYGWPDRRQEQERKEIIEKRKKIFAISSVLAKDAIVKYHSYFKVPNDTIKYKELIDLQYYKRANLNFNYLVRDLVSEHYDIRDALICSNPMMEWATPSLQRDGKNPLVLQIIAKLLLNYAPDSIIESLIPHIQHIRQNTKPCDRTPKTHEKYFYINSKAHKKYFYIYAKAHYDEKNTILTPKEFVKSIFKHKGFISVEELDAIGIIPFTSRAYINKLLDFASKSYNIVTFLRYYSILYHEICDESQPEYEDICLQLNSKICINPYSILLSSVISKTDKMRWLEEQVKSLKTSRYPDKVFSYRDEVLAWFHDMSISRSIKGFSAFSIGKFKGSAPDIRIDIIMTSIAKFLKLKIRTNGRWVLLSQYKTWDRKTKCYLYS
jgi:hypothetical protein